MEEFKSIKGGNDSETLDARKMEIGDSVTGYVKAVKTTPSKKFKETPHITIILQKPDGKDLVVFAASNLRYLKEDLEKKGYELGSFIKITRVPVPSKANPRTKTYFDVAVKEGDVLDLTGGEDVGSAQEEY